MPTSELELRYYRIAVEEQIAKLPKPRWPELNMPLLRPRERFWPVCVPGGPSVAAGSSRESSPSGLTQEMFTQTKTVDL